MFLMFSMLWGGVLAGIPIIVHLLHRQKTTPVQWGAMQFLLESPMKMRRRKWIDNWLLLLIRMALLAMLVIVLARPLLKTGVVKAKAPVDVAVVLDHSLSTGRRVAAGGNAQAGQTLFDQGVGVIEKLRAVLPAGSTISVVLAEHHPQILTPLPLTSNSDINEMLQQLRQVKPGLTDASIPQAVQEARRLVVGAGRNKQKMIVIVSDDQRSGWSVDNPTPWLAALGDRTLGGGQDKDLSVYAISMTGAANAPNVSIGGLSVQPGMLAINRPSEIAFSATNQGPGEMPSFPVDIAVDGRPLMTQMVPPLKAGSSQTFSIPYTFEHAGSHFVSVKAQVVDALDADNTAYAAAMVVQQVNVLIIDGQLTDAGGKGYPAAEYLSDALQAARTAKTKLIGLADAAAQDLDPFEVVILNDVPELPDAFLRKLSDHVLRGHGAWIILGPRTKPEWVNGALAKTPLFPNHIQSRVLPKDSMGLIDIKNPDNPAIAMLTQSEKSAFAGTTVKAWWRLDSPAAGQMTVLEVNAEGTSDPLVLEHPVGGVGGRVIVWTTGADRASGNLPLAMNFLPLVNETAFHLASGLTRAADYQLTQGQDIRWVGPPGSGIPGATITRPDGAKRAAKVDSGDRPVVTYSDAMLPGLYELRLDTSPPPTPIYYAVAIDPAELDSRVLSPAEFTALKDQHVLNDHIAVEDFSAGVVFEIEVPGTDISPWFVFAAVAFLMFETFMTYRAAALQSGSDARELLNQTA